MNIKRLTFARNKHTYAHNFKKKISRSNLCSFLFSLLSHSREKIIIEIEHRSYIHTNIVESSFQEFHSNLQDSIFSSLSFGWITHGDRCFETMNENEWFLGRNAAMLITSRYVISVSVKSFHVSWGRHVSKAVNATARTCVRNVIKIWNCLSAEGERERERD